MISVIMAAYNAEDFIGEAIESVLNQTYPHWELLVVDDGSKDRTQEIVNQYAENDSRVRLIQINHGGASGARNAGLQAAQYPWAAVLDADDVALPERFAVQISAAEADPEIVLWGTYSQDIGPKGELGALHKSGPTSKEEFQTLRDRGEPVVLRNSTILFRRDLALEIGGFDSRLEPCEDLDFWDRLAAHGPVVTLTDNLVLYRRHDGSITNLRFEAGLKVTRFVEERNRARLRGETIEWETFARNYDQVGLPTRVSRRIDSAGRFFGRQAVAAHTEKRPVRAMALLLAATALCPRIMLTRIWKQRAS